MTRFWPLLGLLASFVYAPEAHARSDDDAHALPPLRLYAFAMGVVPLEEDAGVPGIGTNGFLLMGPFEVGATLSAEMTLGYRRAGIGTHAGLRIPLASFELEAAGTLGGSWLHMDGSLLSEDPGAGGSIGFVGGRASIDYVFHRAESSGSQASIALAFSYEHDLEPYTVEYTYVDDGGWGWGSYDDEPSVQRAHKRIGMDRMAIMLALGIGFN